MRFPYAIDGRGRTATAAREEDAVRQLVELVLFTSPGERVMRPSLGTGVQQLVFAPLDDQARAATRHLVQSALQTWLADLVVVEDVQAEALESRLEITVRYRVRSDSRLVVATFTGAPT
ncbi:MAG: GPW/gp25 family protein [Myxococcota bacterium]